MQLPEPAFVYLAPAEAARALRVSRATIWRWLRDGRLGEVRLGKRTTRVRVPRELLNGQPIPNPFDRRGAA